MARLLPYHIEYWLSRGFSEEDAKLKSLDAKSSASRFCINFWLKRGFSEEDAKNKISNIQKQNSAKVKTRVSSTQLTYWINKGFSEEEAKLKLSERQKTFTVDKCITKFGEEEGRREWLKRQFNWQDTINKKTKEELAIINKSKGLTKEQFIDKHGEAKYLDRLSKISKPFYRNSKISLELFFALKESLGKNYKILFGENEQCIRIQLDKIYFFFVDCIYENKIIEFNGDYWHANPLKYNEDKIISSKYKTILAKDIWIKDKKRLDILTAAGYNVLVIWENEYNLNKEETLNKCIKWIKK